jgi:hypothetical protein
MAVRLSNLSTGRALLPRNIFLFLVLISVRGGVKWHLHSLSSDNSVTFSEDHKFGHAVDEDVWSYSAAVS